MNEVQREEIREHRKAFLESCQKIENESIRDLAINLFLREPDIRAVWFEIKGENN